MIIFHPLNKYCNNNNNNDHDKIHGVYIPYPRLFRQLTPNTHIHNQVIYTYTNTNKNKPQQQHQKDNKKIRIKPKYNNLEYSFRFYALCTRYTAHCVTHTLSPINGQRINVQDTRSNPPFCSLPTANLYYSLLKRCSAIYQRARTFRCQMH